MAMPQALLFDVDGTIADTEELHLLSYNQAFLRAGVGWSWSPAQYTDLLRISGGRDRLATFVEGLDRTTEEKARLQQLIPHIHRTKTDEYAARLAEGHVRARPGVVRLINEAVAAGIKIGFVCTSAWANTATLITTVLGGAAPPDSGSVVNAEMVPRKKPAPDVYELLVRMLRVPANACVAFEDSASGVVAARAAGIRVVATPSRWTRGQDFSAADLVLSSLGDPDAPLPEADASRIGGARWLGLSEVSALLT